MLQNLLEQDFYSKYQLHGEDKLFDDLRSLIFHFISIANKWSQDHSESKVILDPEIFFSIISNFGIHEMSLPLVFSHQRENLIDQISMARNLDIPQKNKLRNLIFNFGIKNLVEDEFGHKFIRWAFELMENKQHDFEKFKQTQSNSLINLTKNTNVPITELQPLILNFIKSKLLIYPEFRYLNNTEELINAKKQLFPEIFTTGKPKTIAFNEFIYGLYILISERNSNYMPFIKYVVDELNQINPKYFERNNISVEALRKKVKDQIKLNSK